MRILLSLLVISIALPGCSWVKSWGEEDPNDPLQLEKFEQTLPVKKIWSTQIGDGLDRSGLSLQPAYRDGVIYAADHEGRLYAVDAESGRKRWQSKTELRFSAGPGIANNWLLMGTLDGTVHAFDASDGKEIWNTQLSSEVLSAPTMDSNIIVVRCIDGRVFGLNAGDGSRLWIYDRSVPLLTLRGAAAPVVRGGGVFVGHDNGDVVALRLSDGSVLWEQAIIVPEGRTELDRLADIDGQLAMVASELYASSYKGRVASVAATSGQLLWFKDIASASGVSIGGTNLALTATDGTVWLLDRRNGGALWQQDKLARRLPTRPVIHGNHVVVGDFEGYLHWLSLDSGVFVSREKVDGSGFAAAPLSVGTTLYVLSRDGKLVAYRAGAAI